MTDTMQPKNSNLYTVPLQPGINSFNHPGRFFRLLEAPVPIGVKLGDMSPIRALRAGQGVPLDKGEEFPRYELTNPLPGILRVTYWVGFVDFSDNKIDQIEAATEFAPVADVAGVYVGGVLAAGASIDLLGDVTPGRLRRKAVQVFSLSPDANLLLCDLTGRVGGVVRPGETITQPVSAPIRITNPTAAPLACWLSEIWWTP